MSHPAAEQGPFSGGDHPAFLHCQGFQVSEQPYSPVTGINATDAGQDNALRAGETRQGDLPSVGQGEPHRLSLIEGQGQEAQAA